MKNLTRSGAALPHASATHSRPVASAHAVGLLGQIPPERVGIHGEYDHAGLAKRVTLALQQEFDASLVAQLAISQRGRVVLVYGQGLETRWVRQVTRLILTIDGADYVEVFDTAQTRQLVA
ncbi:MAG: hypothetical protein RLZZ511_1618 [Cyanobacteriota bacterium]|jgi:hypothetical protein